MNVLVACEYSGRVREAFRKLGHDAWSCDLLPSEDNSPNHYTVDAFQAIAWGSWDLVIAHPPCTYLCRAGARWWPLRAREQAEGIEFFMRFAALKIPHAIENPIGLMSSRYRKPDQIIQPWQFGHGETKATCLWLHGLPKLVPTNVVDGRKPVCHWAAPGPNRWKERSRTYTGVAAAMAEQWSQALTDSAQCANTSLQGNEPLIAPLTGSHSTPSPT